MNARTIRRAATIAALALLGFGATACGSGSTPASVAVATSSAPSDSTASDSAAPDSAAPSTDSGGAPTASPVAGASTGHVGDTLTDPDKYVPTDVATVTLVKVIDPVTPVDPSNVPSPGSRWVGLEMTIVDNGNNATQASVTAVVTGSDGKLYSINADIEGAFVGCTSTLADVQPNQMATFCPAYLLPDGVTITKVAYSTRATDSVQPQDISWTVP